MSAAFLDPVVLEGRHVRLEPMGAGHATALAAAAADGELWKLWYTSVPKPEAIDEHVALMLKRRELRTFLPFVVTLRDSGEVVGQTTFCNVDHDHRRVEIGYTWYSQRVQRTAVNTECKWLLLRHAFEEWQCIAVEFRTNWFNQQSRAAIARLGAKQDGVLRSHMRMPDGSLRDTVVFSIIQPEWPAVKANLRYRLDQGDNGHG
ncbi:GNAT family N-acetyltransferase [Lysobacter niastensis]|uniref:GNAT family N-acetyltransferase n=1 Tax=Lysobacter niastensis TaxID=380629 RepID=A0ABS0B4F3_9GAMM|nr:GNAT family protein [Lysobacter niastensis]MBF6023501.1 GNAT family N-acetyltransferase [Lysobacter niastensis]